MIVKTCITETIEALELEGSRIAMALSTLRALIGTAPAAEPAKTDEAPKPKKTARVKKAKQPKAPKPISDARTSDDRNPPGKLSAAVVECVRSTSRSSLEIFEKLTSLGFRTTQGSVYQTCSDLKAKGQIESFEDEKDGTRRYRIVAAKEAAA